MRAGPGGRIAESLGLLVVIPLNIHTPKIASLPLQGDELRTTCISHGVKEAMNNVKIINNHEILISKGSVLVNLGSELTDMDRFLPGIHWVPPTP